jgi:CheY-like chemotaxis protein
VRETIGKLTVEMRPQLHAPGDERFVDGIGFLRILREDERLSRVPVVVMTETTEVTPLLDAGAAEFLRKPLAPADVTETVRRLQIGAA